MEAPEEELVEAGFGVAVELLLLLLLLLLLVEHLGVVLWGFKHRWQFTFILGQQPNWSSLGLGRRRSRSFFWTLSYLLLIISDQSIPIYDSPPARFDRLRVL